MLSVGVFNITSGGGPPVPVDPFGGIQGIHCVDFHGRIISRGVHYVPGPDQCVDCVCDEGGPQLCRAMLCQPPIHQKCKLTRVSTSCCDFICVGDDFGKDNSGGGGRWNGPYGNYTPLDVGVLVPKIIITALLSMLSLSLLFFLVNRLRQRERGRRNALDARRSRQMCDECDDTRSLDYSLYDFERSAVPNSHLFPPQYTAWWKPPSSFFPPRCEAPPPPYEEAIASSNIIPLLPLTSLTAGANAAAIVGENENPQNGNQPKIRIENNIGQNLENSSEILRSREEAAGPSSVEFGPGVNSLHSTSSGAILPPYSSVETAASGSRCAFRRSLTLPRRSSFLSRESEEPFTRNQHRYSLQLHISDWNSSSSSTLSITPSPTPINRTPSSSSLSSSASSIDAT